MNYFASLVIAAFNQVKFTEQCIDSLLRDTDRSPYEIIVIDNGSSDGTRQYLESKARSLDRTRDILIPIFNETNLGVAPAWNQGLRASKGQMIGILNNDILVTKGWFRGLAWAMDHHKLSLVSPYSQCGALDYDLETRASRFTQKNLGRLWHDYDFCAAVMPRLTFEKIGFFDENFRVGGYEDTDYAYRLKAAQMRYGVSGAAFIHHFGSQTLGEFKKLGDKHVGPNRDYFISKWKTDPSAKANTLQHKLKRSWRKLKLGWDRM